MRYRSMPNTNFVKDNVIKMFSNTPDTPVKKKCTTRPLRRIGKIFCKAFMLNNGRSCFGYVRFYTELYAIILYIQIVLHNAMRE